MRMGTLPVRFLFLCGRRRDAEKTARFLVNKAKAENQDISRQVRREMGRHSIDCGDVQISASHGVIHLHGRVRPLRGHEESFEASVNAFLKALRQRIGTRGVYAEWTCIY